MRKLSLLAVLIVIAPALFAQTTGCAAIETQNFNAALSPLSSFGPPNALANVFLTTNANGTAKLHVRSLGLGNNITSIQLFLGSPSSGGTLVQTITDNTNGFAGGRFARDINLDPALMAQIAANPSAYFWVINTNDPNNALIGQLGGANSRTFTGTMNGLTSTGGPADGSGIFVFTLTPRDADTFDLNFDLNTRGIGNDISNLMLTTAGGTSISLMMNSTATNGRLTGSATLTRDQAQQLLCNPSSFNLTARTPAFVNALTGSVQPANEVFIPIAGSVRGANGTNWKTDLTLFNNSGSNSANALVQFFPAGSDAGMAPDVSMQTIAPRGLTTIRDISNTLFHDNGLGGIRIVTADNLIANARIFNDQSSNGKGTFGQFVSGMARSQAISAGLIAGLATTSAANNQAAMHSNVALFNPNSSFVPVSFELRDSTGAVTATRTLTLAPYALTQLPLAGSAGLFNTLSGDVNSSSVFFVSGQPILALGSLVDDVSGDSTIIEAQSDETE